MTSFASPPETLRIDVEDDEIGVVRWLGAPGTPVVFGVHGLTANAWSWAAVARHLDGRVGLVAVDLRGRGMSSTASGPYGIRRHGDDLAVVIERLSAAPTAVAGHSMGAFVAMAAAERHPAVIDELVLVDGGAPLPISDGVAPRDALDILVGPAIGRLRMVWPDRVAYGTFWARHPAFRNQMTPEMARYGLSDLVECDGGFRSSVDEVAIRFDGEELLTDQEMRSLLDRQQRPLTIIRAETGVTGTPPPLLGPELIDRYPQHDWRTVAGTNHYTVMIGDAGAAAVAQALLDAVNSRA